ncbi:MAG TPA: flavocytochrome c [Clostridiales bacterium]|nr:flavocytochrome c [Clostridiales bacterium]
MKRIASLMLVLMLVLGITGCGQAQTQEAKLDGTYEGTGVGKGGNIVVDLTIKNNKISDIAVKEEHETEGLSDAMNIITNDMIETNSLDVDSVSGATLTSAGFKTAVKDAFSKTGAEPSVLVSSGKVEKEKRESEYTADVIVIGAGGAGMTAAITAADNGASVIVLEKMPMQGGNTLLSGGEYAAPGNWLQVKEGIEDSNDLFYNDILTGGDNENDPKLVRVLADNALAGATWLKDEIGMEFEAYLLFFGGHSVKRSLVPINATGYEMSKKLTAKLNEKNIPLHKNTKATELIQDSDGKVVGVKATYDDQTITYNANKGVVLATGGFGANIDMRTKYNPKMDEKILSTNSVGSTGDGITMAENIGAQLVDMEYIQTYPTCDTQSGALLYVGDVRMEGRSILVNKEGKRFVEELERRDVISNAVTEQTGGVSYMFWDESAMEDSGVAVTHESEYNGLLARKQIVKADTIEEAAKFFDIDADELKKTVDNYNQYAKDGEDLEFHKRGELVPFGEGPYYIMVSKPAVHHTMGGVKINTDAQVIDANGNEIKGLFAAGEVTGDIHGTNRLGSDAIADITVFGRIAGQNVAK